MGPQATPYVDLLRVRGIAMGIRCQTVLLLSGFIARKVVRIRRKLTKRPA